MDHDHRAELAKHFVIDPDLAYLNHGSFGACPRAVLDAQSAHRDRAERQLMHFYLDDAWGLLDRSRSALAPIVGCDPADLVFVHNATTGVASVLKNLCLTPGDEVLTTTVEYTACANNLRDACKRSGATLVEARVPWPIQDEDQLFEAVMSEVTDNTTLCMLSLVTSASAVRFPVERLIPALKDRGIETLLDAAHGPGCVEMDIDAWGAAYTTGNAHKWLFAPKGAAFLHVRKDLQANFRPLVLSNDARRLQDAAAKTNRSPFNHQFDYAGTDDVSMYLTIADCAQWIDTTYPGGVSALIEDNAALNLDARVLLCESLGVLPPVPGDLLGPMTTLPVPQGRVTMSARELQDALVHEHRVVVPVWDAPDGSLAFRVSAQVYNTLDQYERLAAAIRTVLKI